MDARLDTYLALIATNFSGRAWQGTTLLGSLRGLPCELAARRPGPRRKSIWEHALHAAYWKYAVRRRIAPHLDAPFPRGPSNWPAQPRVATREAWEADLKVLRGEHALLMHAVESLGERGIVGAKLDALVPKSKSVRYAMLLAGVASHDAYHTGQIQLIKRLIRPARARA